MGQSSWSLRNSDICLLNRRRALFKMSVDMIKEMSKQPKFDYGEESEGAKNFRKKQLEAMSNPVRAIYENNIKQPAGKIFQDFAPGVTEVLPGQAWVVPDMLSAEECADWVACGEAQGLIKPKNPTNRT